MEKKEMTSKEYLQQIRADDLRIEQKIKEYESLLSRKASLVGMDYTVDRVQTSPDGTGFTKIVDRLVDLQQEINDDIDAFCDSQHKKISEIHKLSKPEYIEVLFKRYVEGQALEQIAADMGYSYNWCCHIHGEALKEFEKVRNFP